MYCFWLHFFSFSYYIVCHTMYCFWLHFFLLAITVSVMPCSVSHHTFFFWPLHCLSCHVVFLITLLSLSHYNVCHAMDCFWLHIFLLAITLSVMPCSVSDYTFSLRHYIVCHTMCCFWLHFYLLAITLSVIPCSVSDYTFFS